MAVTLWRTALLDSGLPTGVDGPRTVSSLVALCGRPSVLDFPGSEATDDGLLSMMEAAILGIVVIASLLEVGGNGVTDGIAWAADVFESC